MGFCEIRIFWKIWSDFQIFLENQFFKVFFYILKFFCFWISDFLMISLCSLFLKNEILGLQDSWTPIAWKLWFYLGFAIFLISMKRTATNLKKIAFYDNVVSLS